MSENTINNLLPTEEELIEEGEMDSKLEDWGDYEGLTEANIVAD